MLTLAQVAEATGGRLLGDGADQAVTMVTTDSRSVSAGGLFVALEGPRFDGHDFVEAALAAGATATLIREERAAAGAAAVVVEDTLVALQRLSAWHRARMKATVVGLTGSAGKTTTKELVAAILERCGPTLRTAGNLNNHIGLPLTLLRLEPDHRFAVVEMGCSDFGEIALLASLAAPEVALVTNVGAAHLEKLGDLDGVARAKGELFLTLPESGVAVVNLDDPRVRQMPSPARRRLGYGEREGAQVRLVERRALGDGRQELTIELGDRLLRLTTRLLGEHNARNAVAAAALALAAGADHEAIVSALSEARPAPGRLEPKAGVGGRLVIDDSYNANPDAMIAALSVLAEHRRPGRGLHAILGEMLELGAASAEGHERVGRRAAELGLDSILCVGDGPRGYLRGARAAGLGEEHLVAVETPELAAAKVVGRSGEGDVILVKGSRGARMERAVARLCAQRGEGEA